MTSLSLKKSPAFQLARVSVARVVRRPTTSRPRRQVGLLAAAPIGPLSLRPAPCIPLPVLHRLRSSMSPSLRPSAPPSLARQPPPLPRAPSRSVPASLLPPTGAAVHPTPPPSPAAEHHPSLRRMVLRMRAHGSPLPLDLSTSLATRLLLRILHHRPTVRAPYRRRHPPAARHSHPTAAPCAPTFTSACIITCSTGLTLRGHPPARGSAAMAGAGAGAGGAGAVEVGLGYRWKVAAKAPVQEAGHPRWIRASGNSTALAVGCTPTPAPRGDDVGGIFSARLSTSTRTNRQRVHPRARCAVHGSCRFVGFLGVVRMSE
ncbi:hypothetical protein BS78_K325000 [Paspalum vaginatum]|uniref:Uncharacterized protein n=1 Tax=Paspalum vaginatum TaxID=158149 RepID=A0A9W8CDI9_9POAL|nr:hypothetical protein BS78_K325000 [Paspalum vaginatum]KAJ1254797.1 hypothetical protein BS78_K325000 [Paspalum vaginatum]KAJ1254798.1 hypothetical protein BS78_K325000 [Paspalum vaginatum]KAJ1254799.1 hypothetical protein BS78_K325000 [Paspalum vaginatum]KAJ1254800.1 hypothetical protein BS78_K325000 [Paspalum vaginatum]